MSVSQVAAVSVSIGNEHSLTSSVFKVVHQISIFNHKQNNSRSFNSKSLSSSLALTMSMPDAQVRHLKDQLIRAKVYLSLPSAKANAHFVRELRLRIKEVQRAIADASKDSDLPKTAIEKLKAMEQTLADPRCLFHNGKEATCNAPLRLAEEQLRVHKKQTMFLTQLTAKTIPKGLHCLPLRLTTDYYALNSSEQQFPNQEKLEDANCITMPFSLIMFWLHQLLVTRP